MTKGSGPSHSVAIDASTNRIATAGYLYDANGNMTQMPLMTMGYDVANRMVTSNHSGAGTQTYGYNQANQRIFVRNGSTVTYYLYGMGGERLIEFQETCTGGACSGYQENQRWIYFAGRKMFSKTGATLKAIAPDRLASEAKHFPYGETDGTPPSDTKDYFATYRRDGTGLDYASNRYYSPTIGRFTTADPYGGSVSPGDPSSWNRYSYVVGDPINTTDPLGLVPCGDLFVNSGIFMGRTLREVMSGTESPYLLAQLLFNEAGTVFDSDISNTQGIFDDMPLIATAVFNQFYVDNNQIPVYINGGTRHYPLESAGGRSFDDILLLIAVDSAGPLFSQTGIMRPAGRQRIESVLSTDIESAPLINDKSGRLVNRACEGLITAMQVADGMMSGYLFLKRPNDLTILFWNRASITNIGRFPGSAGYVGYRVNRTQGHTFWGLPSTPSGPQPPLTDRRPAQGRGDRIPQPRSPRGNWY